MKPDELWEKHGNTIDGNIYMGKSGFLAALAEYGAAVSKRDAQLCRNEIAPGASKSEFEAGSNTGCHLCAAAIEREPLP